MKVICHPEQGRHYPPHFLVNGVFQISSTPGQGTLIRVLIPLSEEGADRLRRGG